ncbi:NUDIX domain-containing protein [bacterium]|nr:NUDIX domain-containing protein [bacterium]
MKKKIKVCCLIIICQHKVLILRRNHLGPRNKLWEFPGGKQENGEDELTCIKREVMEEINLKISSAEFFDYIEKEYEDIYRARFLYFSRQRDS